jgi:MraZ protein
LAFRGHYEHSLDAKHRLSIPARFRAAYSSGLVLAKDSDACIAVWTPEVHESALAEALAGMNRLSPEVKKLRRYHEANSFETELDSSGRVTLPPPLLLHAGVEKEVVVAGVGDHIEIWGRDRWQEEQRELDASIGEVTQSLGNLA